jgi:hypothetical protein
MFARLSHLELSEWPLTEDGAWYLTVGTPDSPPGGVGRMLAGDG